MSVDGEQQTKGEVVVEEKGDVVTVKERFEVIAPGWKDTKYYPGGGSVTIEVDRVIIPIVIIRERYRVFGKSLLLDDL